MLNAAFKFVVNSQAPFWLGGLKHGLFFWLLWQFSNKQSVSLLCFHSCISLFGLPTKLLTNVSSSLLRTSVLLEKWVYNLFFGDVTADSKQTNTLHSLHTSHFSTEIAQEITHIHTYMYEYIYVCMHICEHKNVYLCTKMCMCIFLKRRKSICAHCLFFLLFPYCSQELCVSGSSTQSPVLMSCTAPPLNHVIWFLLPYLAHCLLYLFVSISFLLSLPSPAS